MKTKGKVWKIVFLMIVILLMSFAVLTSVNNGSVIGDLLKKSDFLNSMQMKFKNIFKEAIDMKIIPL